MNKLLPTFGFMQLFSSQGVYHQKEFVKESPRYEGLFVLHGQGVRIILKLTNSLLKNRAMQLISNFPMRERSQSPLREKSARNVRKSRPFGEKKHQLRTF